MKKLLSFFSILVVLTVSCKKEEPTITPTEEEEIASITYLSDTKSFILTYRSGKKQTVGAEIDNQTNPPMASIRFNGMTFFVPDATQKDGPIIQPNDRVESVYYDSEKKSFKIKYSDKEIEIKAVINDNTTPPTANLLLPNGIKLEVQDASISAPAKIKLAPTVSQFVYDGLSLFYLWNQDMINNIPTANHTDPKSYFKSLLHKTDTEHSWSWITDNVDELLNDFEGEATDAFGFNPFPLWTDEGRTQLIGFVRYVYPNTPASEAGIVRGNVISKINGENITLSNYTTLYGANRETTFTVLDQDFTNPRDIKITPKSFATDPVLFSKVYEINGKKIAYLFYTGYRSNYNNSLYKIFSEFKRASVTDLVLDLRYNPGGSVASAVYLASLIAPEVVVKNKSPFSIMSYNKFINDVAKKNNWDVTDNLGEYVSNKEQNPLGANLNLNKVYILATGSSASASELTTFCLRPYMSVVHIGEETAGKYTASWTIHGYDKFVKDGQPRAQPVYDISKLSSEQKEELRNWAMQPIVGRYTDKDGKDFIKDGALLPNHPIKTQEYNTETWKPIGDENDYLFAKAISLITGKPYTTSVLRSALNKKLIDAELHSPTESVIRNSIIQDNVNIKPEELQELITRIRSMQE